MFSVGWSWKLRSDPEYFPQQALREVVFHAENLAPDALEGWAQSLAARRFGPAAAPHVLAAWEEIEAAQQIQSDHAYYWHHLRPAWSGPVLRSPLTIEALQTVAFALLAHGRRQGLQRRVSIPPALYGAQRRHLGMPSAEFCRVLI